MLSVGKSILLMFFKYGGIEMELTLKYTLTKDEVINFHLKNAESTKFYKKKLKLQIFTFIIIGIILSSVKLYLILPIIVLSIFTRKLLLKELYQNLTTHYSESKYTNIFQETNLTINSSGITHITALGEKIYKWKGINNIYIIEGTLSSETFMLLETFINEDLIIPLGTSNEFRNIKQIIEDIVKKSHSKIIYNYPFNIEYF